MATEFVAASKANDGVLIDTPDNSADDEFLDLSPKLVDLLASISNPEPPGNRGPSAPVRTHSESAYLCVNNSVGPKPQPSFTGNLNRRAQYRHPLHWRVAIVNKSKGRHDIYHGRTHDLSLSSLSVLIERNVFFTSEVVILLAVPATHPGLKETIIESLCRTTYTFLDSLYNQFRIGMKIVDFKGNGKNILYDILSRRPVPNT